MGLYVDIHLPRDGFTLAVKHDFAGDGVTALFGPSGCGKTTLLRVIAGHEYDAQALVAWDGIEWQGASNLAPHLRQVGYVFQDARLFAHLDVAGNLAFAEKRAKAGNIKRQDVIYGLGIAHLLKREVADLSGGERQRVSIARSLISQPRLMLMDEPLAALDHRAKAGILPLIQSLPRRFGVPVIYVTHALDEVAQVADQVVTMEEGSVIAHGPVAEMLERPDMQGLSGRFEAGSILEGVISSHNTSLHLTQVDVGGLPFEMPHLDAPIGTHLRLRVRARDVTLAIKRPEGISTRNILSGKIVRISPEENTAFTEVLVDLGPARVQARVTHAAVLDLKLVEGSDVFALIKSVSFDRRALPGVKRG
ncbi:MAG: molybdenum ABC transporter ATP-binding protein [Paracoccaceae bacterium]|nr:molybdenum ABC transporter ATP-binding protein [Paracoccaceae bacterium]MDG1736849.1 molybdenum ABC transporter ATP-binding protein [Paracoccaceae bacterium]MDG2260481.1 molybdenum ABC transporter ATP-binding protein [Paracoccaceae bacterium]